MSNPITSRSNDEEIEMLLPFYVTGRLNRSERGLIADHVGERPDLVRQLALIQDERVGAIAANKAIATSPRLDFRRVTAAIAARPSSLRPRPWDRIKRWFEMPVSQSRGWAVAATLLILLQVAAIASLVATRQSHDFFAASGTKQVAGPSTTVLVRFAEGTTTSAIAGMLAGLGMTIVDGPKGGGVFTVRLGPGDMKEAERDRAIAELNARSDAVTFVARLP